MGIDKNIKKKLEDRAIQPSASAWERLSNQLDGYARRKRRRRFFYISSAASILLLLSIFLIKNRANNIEAPIIPENTVVEAPKPVEDLLKEKQMIPLEESSVIATNSTPIKQVPRRNRNTVVRKPKKKEFTPINIKKIENTPKEVIATNKKVTPSAVISTTTEVATIDKKKMNTKRVSVNSEALLYSVTHTEAEVIAYYRAHKIDRNDVLNSIKKELQKSNLKIDAKTILADVERDIDDASFKANFMKIIKKRVSDLATAIASRND